MERCRVLMADDDAEDRACFNETFQSLHSQEVVCYASNGEDLLNKLETRFQQSLPNVIILDLNMPKLNGTETLRRIKSDDRYKNVPVIIYSTSLNPMEKDKCMLLGAHSYITKPVSFKESMDTARSFLAFCGQSPTVPIN